MSYCCPFDLSVGVAPELATTTRRCACPADVDDRSAYRRYAKTQVRAGIVIRALREAGVPLPAVSAAVTSGDTAEVLKNHRRHTRAAQA